MTDARPPRDDLVRAVFPGVRMRSAADGEPRVMTGHFSVFGEWSRIDSAWEGTFMERIAPGAFTKAFQERTPKVLFQHGKDPQVGDKPLGTVRSLQEDGRGAAYEVELLDTSYVRDLIPGLEAGLYGASFRFSVVKEDWDQKPKRSAHNPDGLPERTIREARVPEFGPVTFPAYAGATAGVRSMTDEFLLSRLAADPERLQNLLTSALPARAEAEPHSDAGEPPPLPVPPPTQEARATQDPPTGGSLDSKETPTVDTTTAAVSRTDRPARIADLVRSAGDFANEHTGTLSADEQAQWDAIQSELVELRAAEAADEQRRSFLASLDATTAPARAAAPTGAGTLPGSYQGINVPRQRVRDIYDLAEIRAASRNREDELTLLRESAMRSADDSTFPTAGRQQDVARSQVQDWLDKVTPGEAGADPVREVATRLLQTGSEGYRRTFSKLVAGKHLTAEEQRYAAIAVVGTTTTGGYAVPYQFDPTIIHTGAYTNINPFRVICRVEQIAGGNVWRGVSAGAVLAAYRAEGAAMEEGGPTLALPTYTAQRADSFITLSREALQDRPDLGGELGSLIAEAKDTLEENQFSIGVGTTVYPHGMFVKSKFTVKETITDNTFAVADLDATEAALPLRHRRDAVWMYARGVIRIIQGWETAYGKLFNSTLGYPAVGDIANNPGGNTGMSLLGYPVWETPSAPVTVTGDDTIVGILVSPKNYIIVDRIGMEVEIIPNMFDATTGFPTGQRGLQAFWRNTAGPVNADAGRQININ
jgi:HK97 family phage major capsid protein/HK97 family phage prohead protease